MLHCDADSLALAALGEHLSDEERRHLAACPRCQQVLDQNAAVVSTARQVTNGDIPSEPPTKVWDAISRELGLDLSVTPFVPDPTDAAERGQVIALARYQQRQQQIQSKSRWLTAAAAVAGIAIGAVGVAALPDRAASGDLVAQSELAVVPVNAGGTDLATVDTSGTARIVDTDGQDFAEVDARNLPEVDGYYEVWLIKGDLSGMMSLGALTAGSQGRFTIPVGTDLSVFSIVDVSVENFDGDPTHSKQSLLRGQLDA